MIRDLFGVPFDIPNDGTKEDYDRISMEIILGYKFSFDPGPSLADVVRGKIADLHSTKEE